MKSPWREVEEPRGISLKCVLLIIPYGKKKAETAKLCIEGPCMSLEQK